MEGEAPVDVWSSVASYFDFSLAACIEDAMALPDGVAGAGTLPQLGGSHAPAMHGL
jgi:hypothetical protein